MSKPVPTSRRHWSPQDARAALAAFARSGMTLTAFARSRGVSAQRIAFWKRRFDAEAPSPTPNFVPVALVSSPKREVRLTCADFTLHLPEDIAPDRVAALAAALSRGLRAC